MIPEDKIAEIRERTDIVALIQDFVPLKRVGASFKGLCPFHSEKSASFYVHPERQFYHCFGCQASGDVISFLIKLEGRQFPEVVRTLADRAGVELPVMDAKADEAHQRARAREERLVACMESAAGYYVRMLTEHPLSAMAREEYEGRGITRETAADFRLGYAPHGWDNLTKFLEEKGHAFEDAEALGLVAPRRRGSGHYDRFRHRLLFPITDIKGRIVAFSGRILDPPDDEPLESRIEPGAKYVNSPEGPLYKKGEILFGLYEGRVEARREGWLLVCEGNFDLAALHQAGFKNSVAPMGTALTESHAKLIRRFASRAVLLFDGDKAGKKAVRASAPLLTRVGISSKVITLPPGDDPDTYLRSHGPEGLRRLVDGAKGIVEHLIDDAAADSAGDASLKAKAIGELGTILAAVDNPVERGLYVERVAQKFGVRDIDSVRQQLRRGLRESRGNRRRKRDPGPGRGSDRGSNRSSGGHNGQGEGENRENPPRQSPPLRLPPLEGELLGAILDDPALFGSDVVENFERLLTSQELRAIFQAAAGLVRERGSLDAATLLDQIAGNPAQPWLNGRLAIQKYDAEGAERALRDGIPRLELHNIRRELPELAQRIKDARRVGDEERAMSLTRQHDELRRSAHLLLSAGKR
ncbi:MAG: DNA primase [Deltaproteobacteria bacterium]|nr:DNA primase [Deltaproteobacteria bacterium]